MAYSQVNKVVKGAVATKLLTYLCFKIVQTRNEIKQLVHENVTLKRESADDETDAAMWENEAEMYKRKNKDLRKENAELREQVGYHRRIVKFFLKKTGVTDGSERQDILLDDMVAYCQAVSKLGRQSNDAEDADEESTSSEEEN